MVFLHHVYVHLLFEMHFKYKKLSRVYLNMLHAHKVVSAKTNIFCAVCKKDKFWAYKISVLCETLRAHIEHVSPHTNTIFYFFSF
jgi:hypothetical protein